MRTLVSRNRRFIRMVVNILSILVILALAFPVAGSAQAAPNSPFVGKWEAVDVDGSDIRLSIGGPLSGPFQITWTESKDDSGLGLCEGGPGIIRGTGLLNEDDPFALEADLLVECFTIEKSMEFHLTFRYIPSTDSLATTYPGGLMVVFTHPRSPRASPGQVRLMTNYQEDWASGFYEEGHTVWLAVTESDGISVKATAEMLTGPQPGWDGGEIGFATQPWEWQPEQPDIVPNDWVYAWVDNGASAQMQVGDISAWVDLENDQVLGTVSASWYSQEVYIYCFLWGVTDTRDDTIMADGSEEFTCSWSGSAYDIQPGDVAEVQYYGPDGHAVDYYLFIPNPRFTVFPEWEWFDGYDWPDGALVEITVLDKPECTTQVESQGGFFNGPFGADCDVVIGDTVTFTDGATVRTHTVRSLTVTTVDREANIVAGTADVDEVVYVWPHATGQQLQATADPSNTWQVDFTDVFDLVEGTDGRSEIRDEQGNSTAVDWRVPNPHFSVFPEWEYIEGWEWPDGATVSATIEEKPICSAEGTSGHPEWDPNALFVPLWFPEGCDVVVGDIVTLTDGVTTRTHTVQNLTITAVDQDANTITGTADPGAMVHVWAHGYNELLPTADADGNWIADFTDTGPDLVEGMGGRTEIRDEFGNATSVEWRILKPYIEAAPFSDWIHAREWPLGTLMALEIDDPSDGLGDVDYSATATMQQAPWNPNDPNDIVADFRWPDEFAPGPGYVLTMSGNGQTKTLTISNLNVTGFDLDADTISGVGTANSQIQICANVPNRCITRWVTAAEGSGDWTANYGVPGTGNDDPDTFDVQPGSNGWAAEYEADSDRTWFDWWVPNPRFVVFPEWEWFDGNDWPDGAIVNISVANKPECTTSKVSWGYFFNGSFGEGCDVVVGDVVTFSDSITTRTHTVRNLAITNVDKLANTVSGTADDGASIHAWVHEFGGTEMQLTADGGLWLADFGSNGFDITEGMGGRSEIRDEFGNSTAVDWSIPRPWLNAFPEWDAIYSYEWPAYSEVNLTINNQFVQTVTVGPASWDPNTYTAYFKFNELYDLKPGDVVMLSGSGMELSYTVQNLTVTAVDEFEDTVSGSADAKVEVVVFPHATWQQLWVTADDYGYWQVDFTGTFDLVPGECGRAEIRDGLGNSTAVDWCIPESPPSSRILESGNFNVMWSGTNPEAVTYLSWKGSPNLAGSCTPPNCSGNFEFFGNSWVSENEGTSEFFFASLVGGGTTGSWTQAGTTVDIHSVCLGCWNSADTPVHTSYQFFDEPSKADLIAITRTFEFGETPFAHAIRLFIPRLYPFDGFNQVIYPNVDGILVVTDAICDFGCQVTEWDGSWFLIHNPATGQGVILQRTPSTIVPALWLDWDAASFTNASNFLLLPPEGGFTGTVTETEYLCFYDSETWTPSLTLPEECLP